MNKKSDKQRIYELELEVRRLMKRLMSLEQELGYVRERHRYEDEEHAERVWG